MAVIGFSAPAAFASDGPYHIMTNDNPYVGITYPGVGDQATITSNPGKSYIVPAGTINGQTVYYIRNSNGHCLRMRDANNNYAVMEESTCSFSDHNELYYQNPDLINNTDTFDNVSTRYLLGESCPANDGNKIWGVSGASGTCFRWQLHNTLWQLHNA
jgi:hypothetical protein